jgi:uncharacterized protein (TIGR03067 family)
MTSSIAAVCLGPLLIAATFIPQAPAAMHGTWVVTAAEGKPAPAGLHVTMVITAKGYEGATNGTIDERGTLVVDQTKKPTTIDLVISEGKSAGKIQVGIVEVTGDTMRLALGEPGDPARPSSFETGALTVTRLKPLAKELAGTWDATITLGATTQRVTLTLSNGADGFGTGTIAAADSSGGGTPIGAVVQMGSMVRVIIPAARATFEGTLEGNQLRGTWMQGRQSAPAVFTRR